MQNDYNESGINEVGEEVIIEIKDNVNNINYMGNTLDGVPWNEGGEDKRDFPVAFTEVLKTCLLTGRSKLIIRERFLNLYRHYRKKHKYTNIFHTSSRVIVSVGSIIIPALLTLDNEISERSLTSQTLYYTTFSISLLVTLTNSLAELMQTSKKYYTYATVKESLVNEGWSFLSLSGKYKDYTDHSECWRKFVHRVEKLNTNAVSSNLILSTQKPDDHISDSKIAWNQLTETHTEPSVQSNNIIYSEH